MLDIRDVRAGYGRHEVLLGVDLRVERGEIVALLGPNGCGKTTLLRIVSGVHAATSGVAAIDGLAVHETPAAAIARKVAVVAQSAPLPEGFTALEVVLMGRTPHLRLLQSESMRDIEIARGAMERTECWELRQRYVQELSGGERQRVVIARALAQQPSLLLLDEPTSHLDIQHQVETFRLMLSLCRQQQLAVLAVVHDLTLAAAFADRVALMDGGRIAAIGSPGDVLSADAIGRLYGIAVRVMSHPESGRPIIVPDVEAAAGVTTAEAAS
ncbi:MAG: ABC transporter ATP-binding protein [Dehalococcoidia bacterium]